jgi:hypothetical protein
LQAHAGKTADGTLLGVPLLTEPEDGSSDYNQPRASFADCVQQIFKDCDKAAELLPDQYKDISDVEEITKNKQKYKDLGVQMAGYNLVFGNMARNLVSGKVAQAIKAQTALLATSPAYIDQSGVSYEEAAKICAEVLQNVEFDPDGNKWYNNVEKLASSASIIPEVLWREDWSKADASQESDNFPPSHFGNGRINPTQNLVDVFPMRNGYPISDSRSGYDAKDPYKDRDPRLDDDVIYNGSTFKSVVIVTGTYASPTDGAGNKDNINNPGSKATKTGYYMKKLLRTDAGPSISSSSPANQPHIFPRIRYTELFLAYAETANEAYGPKGSGAGSTLSAYDVIKMIRQRGGIGVDESGNPTSDPYLEECANDKAKMRELIRNERRIELCFENKRFWDMRRWNLSLNEWATGVQISKINDAEEAVAGNLKYEYLNVEERKFEPYQIYGPIPESEVLLWSNLRQNQGW